MPETRDANHRGSGPLGRMDVSRSYRRGIQIVVLTVLASTLVCLGLVRTEPSQVRAAQELSDQAARLGRFELVERSGRIVTDADLADRVWIASFIFTRCPLSCPRITSVMKSLQGRLEGSQVLLVSISVDPEHDTPQVLDAYARSFSALPDRWWFLTGSRSLIYELIRQRFKLSVMENPAPDPDGRGEAIIHSDRLALVDRGTVVGLFDSSESKALDALIAQAKARAVAGWVKTLPTVNASLNALCALLLIVGWTLIRQRPDWKGSAAREISGPVSASSSFLSPRSYMRGHIVCMVLAVLTSAIFLSCYLVYHFHAGSVPFRGHGPVRLLYFTVLLSHTLLATFGVVPLVALTVYRAIKRDFARHMQIAGVTFPIWLYVSITGVVIYLMLYQMPFSSAQLRPPV
jgi:protein SCO1